MKKLSTSTDRISELPDPIIAHILGYLDSEETVKTSVLSKRWLSVWCNLPFLQLDDLFLYNKGYIKTETLLWSFIQFLNKAFSVYIVDGSLQKFALNLYFRKIDCYRINEWILSAMRCKVKELEIFLNDFEDFKLHAPLFVYEGLVSLKLKCEFFIDTLGKVLLPCLKKLHLQGITFTDEESFPKLVSGCPIVEEMHIIECHICNEMSLQIIAPALKLLVYKSQFGYWFEFHNLHVFVEAPLLEDFRWTCSSLAKRYTFKNLSSLRNVYINVSVGIHEDTPNVIKESSLQLIKEIAHSKTVTFTAKTLETLSYVDADKFPEFKYLTKLVLEAHVSLCILLNRFLHNSPILQHLVLEMADDNLYPSSDFTWIDPIQVPKCFLNSLRCISISKFTGQTNILNFMNYVLSNGQAIEKLSVHNKEEDEEIQVTKDLLSTFLEK